jgi:hypothetical protein
MGRTRAGVEREVDRDRHQHAADSRHERHDEAPALAQLADVELAPRLEPDDEEEQDHQPVVDPVPEVLRDAVRPHAHR